MRDRLSLRPALDRGWGLCVYPAVHHRLARYEIASYVVDVYYTRPCKEEIRTRVVSSACLISLLPRSRRSRWNSSRTTTTTAPSANQTSGNRPCSGALASNPRVFSGGGVWCLSSGHYGCPGKLRNLLGCFGWPPCRGSSIPIQNRRGG